MRQEPRLFANTRWRVLDPQVPDHQVPCHSSSVPTPGHDRRPDPVGKLDTTTGASEVEAARRLLPLRLADSTTEVAHQLWGAPRTAPSSPESAWSHIAPRRRCGFQLSTAPRDSERVNNQITDGFPSP
jgi:hypothetical protein